MRCVRCASARNRAQLPIRVQVAKAIRTGKLVPQPCEVCGATKVDAHHDDYSRPLDVRWLCRGHHRRLHYSKKAA